MVTIISILWKRASRRVRLHNQIIAHISKTLASQFSNQYLSFGFLVTQILLKWSCSPLLDFSLVPRSKRDMQKLYVIIRHRKSFIQCQLSLERNKAYKISHCKISSWKIFTWNFLAIFLKTSFKR